MEINGKKFLVIGGAGLIGSHKFAATSKAQEELGVTAQVTHEEGVTRTVEWTRANEATIFRCMIAHAHFVPDVLKYRKQLGRVE